MPKFISADLAMMRADFYLGAGKSIELGFLKPGAYILKDQNASRNFIVKLNKL
jgi:hypothetical protein